MSDRRVVVTFLDPDVEWSLVNLSRAERALTFWTWYRATRGRR